MGIINRTLDTTEQKESLKIGGGPAATATEYCVPVERACLITDAKVLASGISGTPVVSLRALRFVPGTGGSSFSIGTSFAVAAFGTSGFLSMSLPAVGSSLLNLQKGDLLVAAVSGANSAFTSFTLDVIVQNLADIKTWY